MSASKISLAETDEEIGRCFDVMRELRPHLDAENFLRRVQIQRQEGYRLVRLEADGEVVSVAGYRILHNLVWSKFLYVDDLVTRARDHSKGWGQALFAWLLDEARAEGCQQFELDSGVQRFGAHRFYLGQRMDITCHHFSRKLQ